MLLLDLSHPGPFARHCIHGAKLHCDLQAYENDTCVPDNVARISESEDHAQVHVAWIYEQAAGALPAPGRACMGNQFFRLENAGGLRLNPMKIWGYRADEKNLSSFVCSP